MASTDLRISIDLIDKNTAQEVEIHAVDRSILSASDIAFVLDQLPLQTEARVGDVQPHRPYLGIDMFYGKDATVKGLVFATQSRALVVRIPDDTAETSKRLYEEEKARIENSNSKSGRRAKGRSKTKASAPDPTSYERLSNLLKSNLAAFGMAQVSLTLWDTLREKVEGVNLSTATSPPIAPPIRIVPDLTSANEAGSEEPGHKNEKSRRGRRSQGGGRQDNPGDGGGGGRRRRENGGNNRGRGRSGRGRGREGVNGGSEQQAPEQADQSKTTFVTLPEDQEQYWDREILSPGDVVKKIYDSASRIGVNAMFMGQATESNMEDRMLEAVIRAWVSYVVADQLNSSIQDAPIIKPSRLTEEELDFFSKSMVAAWKVMGEEKTGRVVELGDIKAAEKNMIESQSHQSKLRAGKHQDMTFTMKDDSTKTYFINRPFGEKYGKHTRLFEEEDRKDKPDSTDKDQPQGEDDRDRRNGSWKRKGQVRENDEFSSDQRNPADLDPTDPADEPLFDMSEVKEIFLYGREDETMAELERDAFILRLLEGRAALHGPEYDDCEFIRRIWFPTLAQRATGEARKKKNTPAPKEKRFDWVNGLLDDDTDEEAVKPQALGQDREDYDTEDENLGHDLQKNQIIPELAETVNESQRKVIGRVTAPNPRGRARATLVHGPPGTGKTTTISAAVIRLAEAGEPVWIVAQSNVGVRNVAEKLRRVGYSDFILLVARDQYIWWTNRYAELKPWLILTSALSKDNQRKRIHSTKMVLCTLATLSSNMLQKHDVFNHVPLRHLIIDEASQIDMTSEFMHLFFKFRYSLKNVCWFGDPMQLPPYGWSEDRKIDDIFKIPHLLANSKLLDTSYRLPVPIADFISKNVYEEKLQPWPDHPVHDPTNAILFIDVSEGEEKREENGTSFTNDAEAELVVKIVELYYNKTNQETGEKYDYQIITPYDAQRRLVAKLLKDKGLEREVYNVDSFQGNEAEYIITTLTKTTFSSFVKSINRLNVLLTRCRRGLVILTQKDFVARTGGLLTGLSYSYDSKGIWATSEDVRNGYVDLPGSHAPNEPESSDDESGESEMSEMSTEYKEHSSIKC